jgi:phage terminase large subunit
MTEFDIKMPPQYKELFNPKWSHIVYYGGRGGAKSYNIALALLIMGLQGKEKVLCTREVQKSISDSVHALMQSLIERYGMNQYKILKNKIVNEDNGTEIIFNHGLRKESVDNIKSIPNLSKVWVEEAHNVSAGSIDKLDPTVREDGSQIFWSFNPESESDPVYKKIVEPADEDTFVMKINSYDVESFVSDKLKKKREKMKTENPELFRHIWMGEPLTAAAGSIFARYVARARNEGRVGEFPYVETYPVHTAWDIGTTDSTAIWFYQIRDGAVYFIDYVEDFDRPIANYLRDLRDRDYDYGTLFLPHDSDNKSGKSSSIDQIEVTTIYEDMQKFAPEYKFELLPPNRGYAAIEKARNKFTTFYFDNKCARGLQCLEAYHYQWSEENKILASKPKHDWSSNGADAFQYVVMSLGMLQDIPKVPLRSYPPTFFRGGSGLG